MNAKRTILATGILFSAFALSLPAALLAQQANPDPTPITNSRVQPGRFLALHRGDIPT
jgi:hypothetical protein